jgi:tetratricopeptide (TPR) repeat protein
MKKTSKTTSPKATPESVPSNGKAHTEMFARATKQFNAGEFEDAKRLFELCTQGPEITVRESAHMYVRMCAKRMEKPELVLNTAEDHYTYAVGLMNLQKFGDALPHLQTAMRMGDGPHVRYALALASGLVGDMPGAVAHLQKAIALDPGTRNLARSDADFKPLMQDPVIRELVSAPRN